VKLGDLLIYDGFGGSEITARSKHLSNDGEIRFTNCHLVSYGFYRGRLLCTLSSVDTGCTEKPYLS
jgi:hypothetical protein